MPKPDTSFRVAYERYKRLAFLEQVIRVSNVMFLVFTYWNLVRIWAGVDGLRPVWVLAPVVAGAALSGLAMGALFLISFGRMFHLLALPVTFACCSVTIEVFDRIWFVPSFAVISLLLVRASIGAVNVVNRW